MFGPLMLEVPNLQQHARRQHGGSLPGHSPNVVQECKVGHSQIVRNYFVEHPIYNNRLFHHRYQTCHTLFLHIMDNICAHAKYFVQKINACGVVGLSSIQKCRCAMCMLAYGQVVDAYNEYCRIGESSTFECLWCFVRKIKEVFELYFLRTVPSGFLKVQFFFSSSSLLPLFKIIYIIFFLSLNLVKFISGC